MWLLSRPLIESWTADALGPQARVRHAAGEIVSIVARLPELARRVEHGLVAVADGYLRIHPESLRELRGRGGTAFFAWVVTAVVVGVIIGMVIG
jgi:ubiquinone biosynthesis protein